MSASSSAASGSIVFALLVPDPLDPLGGFVEDVDHFLQQLLVPAFLGDPVAQSGHQVPDCPADLGTLAAAAVMAMPLEAFDQLLDVGRVLLEMLAAFRG